MRRTIRAVVLALTLSSGLVIAPVAMQGCASVFQSDPVGASLFTIKATYESSVRTAGRMYVQGLITEVQLRRFRDEANKFYKSYTAIVALHEEGKVAEGSVTIKNLQLAVNALEAIVVSFTAISK